MSTKMMLNDDVECADLQDVQKVMMKRNDGDDDDQLESGSCLFSGHSTISAVKCK